MANSLNQATAHLAKPLTDQAPELNSQLLHHLVDFSRVFQKHASDPEVSELIKKNNVLVNQLLRSSPSKASTAVKPIENAVVVWDEVLMKKLAESQVDLTDTKVKVHADKQVQATSKKIDRLIGAFVRDASSFGRSEDTVTFEFDPRRYELPTKENIYLRSLTFSVSLQKSPVGLTIICNGLPADKSCKARVEIVIKNHAGRREFVRSFVKVFYPGGNAYSNAAQNAGAGFRRGLYTYGTLSVRDLIRADEYTDESLGFLKDGKLTAAVTIQADELADYKQPEPAAPYNYDDYY